MATHAGHGRHGNRGDEVSNSPADKHSNPGFRALCGRRVAAWISRHQVLGVLTVLLTIYATAMLAPGYLAPSGFTCEAKACRLMRGPYYSGLDCSGVEKAWIVVKVKSILNEPGSGELARGTMTGEILEVLKGDLKVGSEIAVVGSTSYLAVDSAAACLLSTTEGDGPSGGRLLPLTAPYTECGLYRAMRMRCAFSKDGPAKARVDQLAHDFEALDAGNAYDDGRMFLLNLLDGIDLSAGLNGELASPVLVEQLLKMVRQDLARLPKPVADIHWALCSGHVADREHQEALVANQMQTRLAGILTMVTAPIESFAKLESWTQAISQSPMLVQYLSRVAGSCEDPASQAYVGRQLANWLATALAEHRNKLPDNERRWSLNNLPQLLSVCATMRATAALPLVRTLAAGLSPDGKNASDWQQRSILEQALVTQLTLSGGADATAVEEIWKNGFRPYELSTALLETSPGMMPRYLAAMLEQPFNNDLDALRSLPPDQADSALLAADRRGRHEALQYVSAEALRQPEVLSRIVSHWQAHDEEYQTWFALLYRATGEQVQTNEEWETWYWGELRKFEVSPDIEARVRAELERCVSPEAATRQAACKAIVQLGGPALAAVARTEQADRRLAIRDAARGLLRTQPPAVNLFRETRYTAEADLLAALPRK